MATPATRETLKQYALRALGKPVIEINVDDDQLEDRLDEALQYFAQYHYDGIQRAYLKYQYTQADKDRMTADSTESITKNSVSSETLFFFQPAIFGIILPPQPLWMAPLMFLHSKNEYSQHLSLISQFLGWIKKSICLF